MAAAEVRGTMITPGPAIITMVSGIIVIIAMVIIAPVVGIKSYVGRSSITIVISRIARTGIPNVSRAARKQERQSQYKNHRFHNNLLSEA